MEEKVVQTDVRQLQIATFIAGCFWGVEEAFTRLKGVKSTMAGYTGGWLQNPKYKDVCNHDTGHVEAVQIQFDPNEVSYEVLLHVFWSIHDPTTKNRQGPDIGSQYRSMIAFHTLDQEALARKSIEELRKSTRFRNEIITEVVPASTFHKAEDYHQRYYQRRGGSSCYNIY